MNTCKTCKFWIQPKDDPHPTVGVCTAGKIGQCYVTGFLSGPIMDGVGAFVRSDDPHTNINLRTGPDFGCIHHAPKQ